MGLVKAPLRWLIKFVVVHPLVSVALVVLLGASYMLYAGVVPQPLGANAGAANTNITTVMPKGNLPAPTSTENFMNGQVTYNADLVWDALSNDLHDSLATQGSDKQAIQAQLDKYKQDGRQMENFTYVGGYAPSAEKSFYFYVASIRRPEAGGKADQVFFAFTLDQQGKIVSVE